MILNLKQKFRKGFGLLEVMISGAVIIIILGSLVLVAHAAINNNQYMQKRAEATFLAQEGLEMVRQIRDSNWIDQSISTNPSTVYGHTKWDSVQLYPEVGVVDGSYVYDPSLYTDVGCYRQNNNFMTYPGINVANHQRRFSLQSKPVANAIACRNLVDTLTPDTNLVQTISVYPINASYENPDLPPDAKLADSVDKQAPANTFYRVFFIDRDLGQLLPNVSGDIHPDVNAYKVTVYVGFSFNGKKKIVEVSDILTNWRPSF